MKPKKAKEEFLEVKNSASCFALGACAKLTQFLRGITSLHIAHDVCKLRRCNKVTFTGNMGNLLETVVFF